MAGMQNWKRKCTHIWSAGTEDRVVFNMAWSYLMKWRAVVSSNPMVDCPTHLIELSVLEVTTLLEYSTPLRLV